jgi:signal transduction histidine kinase/CheY-like chemotaxis protein
LNFLRGFHNIVSDQNQGFDDKIDSLLKFGLDVFKLDLAIISKVKGNSYTVLHAITPDNSLAIGTTFDLSSTYCVHTLEANSALTFHRASESRIANHPCYLNFQLESYIGAPIKIGSNIFGTVNFSSPDVSTPFTQEAYDYVELFAQWLGSGFAQKIATQQLIENNNTLLKLENVANIGTWEVNLIDNSMSWSQQTRFIHQVSRSYTPTLEAAITFFRQGESRQKITEAVELAIKNNDKWHLELELITAKKQHLWVSTFGEAQFIEGKCVRLFGTLQDITESVTLRNELTEKKAQAERLLEDRSMLLAKISHELRTPLNGITGMLTSLLDEHREEKRIEKLNIGLRSADILLSIINEVLDFSKINHGELKLEPTHFLLKTIFVDVVSLYTPLFKEKKVCFETYINIPDNYWAYSDNTRLSQIISNLLSNALKFTDQGVVKFTTNVTIVESKIALNIDVADTGSGMTELFLGSLFSPFTQEVNAKRSKGGTGLGLAIVKELIDYMQGTVTVTSALNKGTTFSVNIPLEVGKAQVEHDPHSNFDIDDIALSVLVVDDNQINRLVIESYLEKLNIKAEFAFDGRDAVFKCRQKHYNLIFMDCVMPELDGLEATAILRNQNICCHKDTFIVALTANTSSADKQACHEAGMDMFISKPFKLPLIEEAVISAIKKLGL